jgi:hypothetical protein
VDSDDRSYLSKLGPLEYFVNDLSNQFELVIWKLFGIYWKVICKLSSHVVIDAAGCVTTDDCGSELNAPRLKCTGTCLITVLTLHIVVSCKPKLVVLAKPALIGLHISVLH